MNTAVWNAMVHGMGFIKVTNTPTGVFVEVIEPEEYLMVSEAMKWAAENMVRTDQ
jgi:hypothetical protein